VPLRIDQRVRRPELSKPMHVSVADDGLVMCACPSLGADVEVDLPREHRVALDGVEEPRVSIQVLPQTRGGREEWMRCDDQSRRPRLQRGKLSERTHFIGIPLEVQQQDVFALDCALDTRNEDDAAF
jgi:hypothetical protein